MIGEPFCLGSGTLVVPSSKGPVKFNSQQTIPSFRRPYLIREIRFRGEASGGGGGSPSWFQWAIRVRLMAGAKAITYDHVPIGNFCPQIQHTQEVVVAVYGSNPYQDANLRWVLPVPLYMQPGEGIIGEAILADGDTAPENIEMAVVGEVLPDGFQIPKTQKVPYVNTFSSLAIANNQSDSIRFQNPFSDKPLYLQRLIGRWTNDTALENNNGLPLVSPTSPIVSLYDSEGVDILPRSGVRFGEAFDARTNVLQCERVLAPKDYLTAIISQGLTLNSNLNLYISMIGWREENIGGSG